jgi:pyruvate-ferredoxin/flavodoxin oxidoreductase
VRKSPGIFAYNGNKQAFVKNPRGGSFKELVVAAEACTAKIIHPGTPWDKNEPDLALLVERAKRFA